MVSSQQPHGSTLDRPATAAALRALFWAGLLPRRGLEQAMQEIGSERHWRQRSNLLLLVLGLGLVLAGIIYFVAYNWLEMDKAIKLGGLQGLVLVSVGAALWRGLEKVEGRALLFVASVLVGVFLAAFGQTYQTGADAYELFSAWALLILLWVVASRAQVHWLLLLAVADLAIATYLEPVRFYHLDRDSWGWLCLATSQIVALVGFERFKNRGYFRSPQIWPRWLLVPVLLFHLCVPAAAIILEDRYDRPASWLVLASLAGCTGAGYLYYRRVVRDLFALTCIGFAGAFTVMILATRALGVFERGNCASLLLVGLLVILLIGILVRWVRRLNIEFREQEADG